MEYCLGCLLRFRNLIEKRDCFLTKTQTCLVVAVRTHVHVHCLQYYVNDSSEFRSLFEQLQLSGKTKSTSYTQFSFTSLPPSPPPLSPLGKSSIFSVVVLLLKRGAKTDAVDSEGKVCWKITLYIHAVHVHVP